MEVIGKPQSINSKRAGPEDGFTQANKGIRNRRDSITNTVISNSFKVLEVEDEGDGSVEKDKEGGGEERNLSQPNG